MFSLNLISGKFKKTKLIDILQRLIFAKAILKGNIPLNMF